MITSSSANPTRKLDDAAAPVPPGGGPSNCEGQTASPTGSQFPTLKLKPAACKEKLTN